SKTDVNVFDISDSLRLSRAWIEFLIPVGQIAVGRMESHWATGIQSHAGSGGSGELSSDCEGCCGATVACSAGNCAFMGCVDPSSQHCDELP
ncbi:MAG: hypothetical protein WCB63_05045, partial [Polyangiales bacterium]